MSGRPPIPSNDTSDEIFNTNKYARYYRYFMMYFVAIFGYIWIFIAGAQILMKNTSTGVSIGAIAIFMSVSISWLLYGFLQQDKVIIIGSIISIIGQFFMLIAIFVVDLND